MFAKNDWPMVGSAIFLICRQNSATLSVNRPALSAMNRSALIAKPPSSARKRYCYPRSMRLRGEKPTSESAPDVARYGTLDWVFAEYRKNRRGAYHKLSPRQKRNHENGYRLVVNRRLDEGRGPRIGSLPVGRIDTGFVDTLYENLLVVRDEKGM
jgi:hypothetical protein